MPRQNINIGISPNDGTGDPLRTGGEKINENFIEVYNLLNNKARVVYIPIDWTQDVQTQMISYVNNTGLQVGKDEILLLKTIKTTYAPSGGSITFSSIIHYYLWTAGEGEYGTPFSSPITNPQWFLLSSIIPSSDNTYNLGDIGTTPIEDAVNASGPYPVSPGVSTIFIAERSGDSHVYLYVGNVNGTIGLGTNQTAADDFVDLTEEPAPPIDPNDYVTNAAFDNSLYDTAETGFSTDLSNFTSLTEKFYFLRISGEGDTVYFASKETNTEDFVGSRIFISATGTKHDLGAPDVTQNGYHFWDIGVLPVTINPSTEDWAFQAWFDTETDDLQSVTDKGNKTTNNVVVVGGGVSRNFSIEDPSGNTLIQMRSIFNGASFFWVSKRDGSGALVQSLQLYTDRIDTLNLGTFLFPNKAGATDTFAMLSDLTGFADDDDVLHDTGEPDKVAMKDDSGKDIFIGKEFDEGTTAYVSTAELITEGYTTANGYVQGTEIIMRNTGTYTRYEKMSDDDNDWWFYTNANGWQVLPLT